MQMLAPAILADSGDAILILVRVLHTTCGATLLGGLIYLRFVLAPAAIEGDAEAVLYAGRRRAWAACVAVCTALLLFSGFYNFVNYVTGYEKLAPPYQALFRVKFLLALVVFAIAALVAGKSGAAVKVRAKLKLWLNVAVAAALAIFVIGAILRSIPHIPKAPEIESEAPAFEPAGGNDEVPSLPAP